MTVLTSLLLVLAITRFDVNGQLSQNNAVSSVNDRGITLSSPAASTEGSMVTTGVSSITTEQIKAQKRDSTPNGDSGQETRECGNAETGNHISAADESNKNSARDTEDSFYRLSYCVFAGATGLLSVCFTSYFGCKHAFVHFGPGITPAPRFLAIQDLVLLLYPFISLQIGLRASICTFILVFEVPVFYRTYLISSPLKQEIVKNAFQKCLKLAGINAILTFTVTLVFLLDKFYQNTMRFHQHSNKTSSDLEMGA